MRKSNLPSYKVGDVVKTNTGECTIIEYNNATDVVVEFNDKNMYQCKTSAVELRRGTTRNLFYPSVKGVGFIGEGRYTSKHKHYRTWVSLIKNGTIVSGDDFCDFQIFCSWFDGVKKPSVKFVVVASRQFELECEGFCLIPVELYRITDINRSKSEVYLKGVYKSTKTSTKPYSAYSIRNMKRLYLGSFDTQEEAHEAYVRYKEGEVKALAERYKEFLSNSVYNYYMGWTVKEEISRDKEKRGGD